MRRKPRSHIFAPAFDYGGSGVGIPLVGFPTDLEHLRAINSMMLMLSDPAREDAALAARRQVALAGPGDPILTQQREPEAHAAALQTLLDDAPADSPFASFDAEQLGALLGRADILTCGQGLKLISARQNTRTVYVVLEGELVGAREGREFRVGRGELVGELALLTGRKRTADIHVRSASARVLCLSEKTMDALMDGDSPGSARFLRNLSRILATRLAS